MPLYTYFCTSCNEEANIIRPIEERDEQLLCLNCGNEMKRRIASGVTFSFKAGTKVLENGTKITDRKSYV